MSKPLLSHNLVRVIKSKMKSKEKHSIIIVERGTCAIQYIQEIFGEITSSVNVEIVHIFADNTLEIFNEITGNDSWIGDIKFGFHLSSLPGLFAYKIITENPDIILLMPGRYPDGANRLKIDEKIEGELNDIIENWGGKEGHYTIIEDYVVYVCVLRKKEENHEEIRVVFFFIGRKDEYSVNAHSQINIPENLDSRLDYSIQNLPSEENNFSYLDADLARPLSTPHKIYIGIRDQIDKRPDKGEKCQAFVLYNFQSIKDVDLNNALVKLSELSCKHDAYPYLFFIVINSAELITYSNIETFVEKGLNDQKFDYIDP